MPTRLRAKVRACYFLLFLALGLLLTAPVAKAEAATDGNGISSAIVKVYTVSSRPNYYWPWQRRTNQMTGSGVVIEGRKILTNAHVVTDRTYVEVRRNGDPKRYQAKVLTISHDADLALLTVEDESFYSNLHPLGLGDLPSSQQEVLVYGFPTGGDTLSITKGIISRIEHVTYSHSGIRFLAGQIDAAINPGNSGGPVISDGKVVGIAMQGRRDADNIGYFIPVSIIRHLLTDIADGRHDGFPELGIITQPMENPSLKKMHQMPAQLTGVLVRHILPGSTAHGLLQPDDILLTIDGHPIADDETVEFRPMERTSYGYFVDSHQIGDDLKLAILRKGKQLDISVPLRFTAQQLMKNSLLQYDVQPRYFIFGGLVFSPLSANLLHEWGANWRQLAPNSLITAIENMALSDTDREPVVILQVLASDMNKGYHNLRGLLVDKINGEEYRDFKDLYAKVFATPGPYVVFSDSYGNQYVINKRKALEEHEQLLRTYRIPEDRSSDLQPPLMQSLSGSTQLPGQPEQNL